MPSQSNAPAPTYSEGLQSASEAEAAGVDPAMYKEQAVPGSVMNDVPQANDGIVRSAAPLRPEVRTKIEQRFDAATPEQRAAMANMPTAAGQVWNQRAAEYQQMDSAGVTNQIDARAEVRAARLAKNGLDPVIAEGQGRFEAMGGAPVGVATNEGVFDFDTQKQFNESKFFSNPVVRGAVKGYEGYKQGVLGINQFIADKVGADDWAKGFAKRGVDSRAFTKSMGDPKNYAQSTFENIISSIGQQLPAMIGGAVTGSEALVLSTMFAQSFGQEYGEGRSSGQTQDQALVRAAQFAAFEVIGEKFGLKQNMKGWKEITRGNFDKAAKAIASALKYEVPGEMLTTTGQFLTDKEGRGIGLHTDAGVRNTCSRWSTLLCRRSGKRC